MNCRYFLLGVMFISFIAQGVCNEEKLQSDLQNIIVKRIPLNIEPEKINIFWGWEQIKNAMPNNIIAHFDLISPAKYRDLNIDELLKLNFKDKKGVEQDIKYKIIDAGSANAKDGMIIRFFFVILPDVFNHYDISVSINVQDKYTSLTKVTDKPFVLSKPRSILSGDFLSTVNLYLSTGKYSQAEGLLKTEFDFNSVYDVNYKIITTAVLLQVRLVSSRDGYLAGVKELKRLIDIKWGGDNPEQDILLIHLDILNAIAKESPNKKMDHITWFKINELCREMLKD